MRVPLRVLPEAKEAVERSVAASFSQEAHHSTIEDNGSIYIEKLGLGSLKTCPCPAKCKKHYETGTISFVKQESTLTSGLGVVLHKVLR